MGESIGHYEGNDTLVADTIGFNGRTWLDYVGHPSSESLHVVEKFSRPDSADHPGVRGNHRRQGNVYSSRGRLSFM